MGDMAVVPQTRSPSVPRATITAEALRRIVVRAPYCRDMRARMTRCGGAPRWEPDHGVWTMPPATLSAVVAEVVATFGATLVRIEVAHGSGPSRAPAGHVLGDAVGETLQHAALQDVLVCRVRSVDRPGYVWLSYQLTAEPPAIFCSPC